MGIFNFGKKATTQPITPGSQASAASAAPVDAGKLAILALETIQDGILIVNKDGVIKYINPAAAEMTGCGKPENAINLDYALVMKFEKNDGSRVDEQNNEFLNAVKTNQAFESREYVLVSKQADKKTPIALRLTPSGEGHNDRIVTFRNIAKELEEEGAQTEFISTASHEMRTPVASIEGYLGLALNPQTATIDARAKQYLESAHNASKHLGNLFRDLLDVTKLDDKRIHAHNVPLELTGFVKKFADEYIPKFKEKNLNYSFGADTTKNPRVVGGKTIEQVVYTFADVDYLGEIMANLIENAIKYTPEGGAVWVNVQGDGDRALINVTDTGIGIAAEDLQHIFQKFYRADNSQTRTVGGTGLGLYLVKARVEAMAGRVWAESAFGEGSTFYVSLPRLTAEEFEKRQIAEQNQKAVQAFTEQSMTKNATQTVVGAPAFAQAPSFDPSVLTAAPAPVPIVAPQPEASVSQPAPAPVAQPTPSPVAPEAPAPVASPAPAPVPTAQPAMQQVQAPVYQQPAMPTVGVAPTLQPVAPPQPAPTPVAPEAQPAVPSPQVPQAPTLQPQVPQPQPPQPQQAPSAPQPTPMVVPNSMMNEFGAQTVQNNQNIIQ
ncbi:PAS domain-containing protein [Candidatus Saccharibacteria bacterium]|nr:PAS domain-containing protein [Candidatus Saccharibacteria bacterium]